MGRHHRLVMVGLHFIVHEVLDLQRVEVAGDHHPQIVGDKLDQVMVGQQIRVAREQRAAFRLLHIVLDGHQAFLARLGQDVVEHGHHGQVALLGVLGSLEHRGKRRHAGLQVLAGVGHDEGAEGCATDHQQLQRLEQRTDVAARHRITANDGRDHDDVSDDDKHVVYPLTGSHRAWARGSPPFRSIPAILEHRPALRHP